MLDLVLLEFSISIKIHGSEDLVDLLLLLLREKLTGNESIGGLLKLGLGIEVLEVGKSTDGHLTADLALGLFGGYLDPWMLQSLFGGWSLFLVLG